jgi:iron uptake system component EfeO
MRRVLVGVAVAAVGVTLTACESTSDSGSNAKGVEAVNVKLTKKGCSPARIGVKAGPTTFNVVNDGADAVTEFEVLDGGKILGEKENLTPGLSGKFSLTLKEGKYVTYCPGGSTDERGALVVGGGAAAKATTPQDAALSRQAVTAYKTYVAQETAQLVVATTAFENAVKAGDIEQAKQLYPTARQHYEAVEPIAESFGDLDPEIDAREGDVPDAQFGGFHRIEKALWQDGTTEGMAPVAQKLEKDVTELKEKVETVKLEPATIANGAVELLNEVSTSKITGEEERYSHLDLVDFQANVDGAKAAFDAVKPLLAAKDASTANEITERFADVNTALAAYKNGSGQYDFVLYTQLTPDDTKKLSAAVDALAEPLSQVAKQVVG